MNKFKLLVAPLLVIPFIASCGGGGSDEYKVSIPDTNGVSVYPGQAYKDKDYDGTIAIATDITDTQLLPDKLDKVTSGNKELQPTDYTYTLKEDKLTADFKVPAANVVGDIQIELTLVEKDPYQVSEEEFKKALSFDGVEYMQAAATITSLSTASIAECSPTVSHNVTESHVTTPFPYDWYEEKFVSKKGDVYTQYNRTDKTQEKYDVSDATEDDFITPKKAGTQFLESLTKSGLTFDKFSYNKTNKTYTASYETKITEETTIEVTLELKFENKKLINYVASDLSGLSNTNVTFSYVEKTPDLPNNN